MSKQKANNSFSNIEIVTLAIFLLGGESSFVDTEDIAVKVNELAPGRFTWRKYPKQINIDNVRKRLSDAKNPAKGGYVTGSFTRGWSLTENGLNFCRKRINDLQGVDISRPPIDKKELAWRAREKTRMLTTTAYEKFMAGHPERITYQEAEIFFRLDDYVKGEARKRKLARILNAFQGDAHLGDLLQILAAKARRNDGEKHG